MSIKSNQIQNIWCVGRNYADHAKELGNKVPESPLFFLKSGSCLVTAPGRFTWPKLLGELHFEVELAVQFDASLEVSRAGVAIDLTARDRQNELKKQGYPWTLAKSFKNACLVGDLKPTTDLNELQNRGEIFLSVNGEVRQHGFFKDMIFNISALRAYVLEVFPVQPGDLLLTGTPQGVGPVKQGDVLSAWIDSTHKYEWIAGGNAV